jgi:LDH2 family malate/lactate/ureidoglycolate dehydrogenase
MGVLSSMLSGAAYGTELGDMENGPVSGTDGHFFMAFNVDFFVDLDKFTSRVDKAIQQVHNTRKAPGVERVWMPGEREFETRIQNTEHGIPLGEETLSDLVSAAESAGVNAASYGLNQYE